MAPAAKGGQTAHEKSSPAMQDKSKSANDMKAEPATKSSASGNQPATNAKDAKNPADAKSDTTKAAGTDSKSGADSKTTGNAATSATSAPPAEKRTQITSAFKQEKVTEVTNVNFNISVGTTVPASVRFQPLPPRIVEIYPEWRGYDVILVRGRYVILRPETHEIVYIIEG